MWIISSLDSCDVATPTNLGRLDHAAMGNGASTRAGGRGVHVAGSDETAPSSVEVGLSSHAIYRLVVIATFFS